MKKYTHAWLAMMAMKRLEKAAIPDKYKPDAEALVTWFKNYRDFVISGAWYPDSVIKDMGTSHILKYVPDADPHEVTFRTMPPSLKVYNYCLDSDLYGKSFTIKMGNLCDRCESFTESLIDSFKILESEGKGTPISPSCNHIAMRFFILSHYIADCHMPLHCDGRSFASENEVHAFIEEMWDEQVRESYSLDEPNERFFYDPEGYPLKKEITPMMAYVEKDLVEREFIWDWGKSCGNTWDYMSGVSQYSFLMAYKLVPADDEPGNITKKSYMASKAYNEHFEEYSKMILSDAVESIAKVWLHSWCRFRNWLRNCELADLRADTKTAKKAWTDAQKIIDTYPAKIDDATAALAKKKGATLEKAKAKIETMEAELANATKSLESLKIKYEALEIITAQKTAEYKLLP